MSFIDDKEKMEDFYKLSKEEFLNSYSYLTEKEYNETLTKIDAKRLITIAEKTLKENEEYEGEYKNYEVCYILKDLEEIKDSIIMASNEEEMIQIDPFDDEIIGIMDWAYNIDEDVFEQLQDHNKIIEYMNMDTHYGIWCNVEEWYPEDIEYKKGMQEYLKYCKENGITKEKIEQDVKNAKVTDIMKFYKDKTKNKEDRY